MEKQTKFKTEDRVRLIRDDGTLPEAAEVGMVGVVIDPEPFKDTPAVAVDLDDIPRNHGCLGEGWFFDVNILESEEDNG